MENRNELIALGTHIRLIREELRMSQEQFASLCGLTKNYISMLERGERNPSYLTLLQIARATKQTIKI